MSQRLRFNSACAVMTFVLCGTAAAQTPAAPGTGAANFEEQSQPSREQCLDAHRNAQELKQTGKFIEAQTHLVVCSSASCPGAVISRTAARGSATSRR